MRAILALTALLSACSLSWQMILSGSFVMITGDSVLWQCLTIGIYLASIGAGSFVCGRRKVRDPWALLYKVELPLIVLGVMGVFGVLGTDIIYNAWLRYFWHVDMMRLREPPLWAANLITMSGHVFTVAVGFLGGFEIPLLLDLARKEGGRESSDKVLALNYAGALIGTLAFNFLLLPKLDLFYASTVVALFVITACLWMLLSGRVKIDARRLGALVGTVLFVAAAARAAAPYYRLQILNFYAVQIGTAADLVENTARRPTLLQILSETMKKSSRVERIQTRYQRIDLVSDEPDRSNISLLYNKRIEQKDFPTGFSLFLDRKFQFKAEAEAIYHEHMAHVPIQVFGRIPEEVLIMGGGDGLLAKEFLKYGDRVRSITDIELDPKMVQLARSDPRLRRLNEGSFLNPKVEVLTEDAFFWIRNTPRLFDMICIDFPYPYNHELLRLFSVEFFRNVGRHLKPHGFAVVDFPLYEAGTRWSGTVMGDNSLIFSTIAAAGYQTVFPWTTESPELLSFDEAKALHFPLPDLLMPLMKYRVASFRHDWPRIAARVPTGEKAIVVENDSDETMVAFSLESRPLNFAFHDNGIRLYHLNAERLGVLEGREFPREISESHVNSIFRPVSIRHTPRIDWD